VLERLEAAERRANRVGPMASSWDDIESLRGRRDRALLACLWFFTVTVAPGTNAPGLIEHGS